MLPVELKTDLRLPRVNFAQTISLKNSLIDIGLDAIFEEMSDVTPDDVMHAFSFICDESGSNKPTGAYKRDYAVINALKLPMRSYLFLALIDRLDAAKKQIGTIDFKVDREFMFFMKDGNSSLVTAMGLVRSPSQANTHERDEL